MQARAERTGSIARDERGITMIETLTALILFGMVASILYSFLFMGTSMYKKVTADTQIRNQGDALFGGIMSELRDAVYAEQGADSTEIIYTKKAANEEDYVDRYRMKIEIIDSEHGVTVYKEDEAGLHLLKRFSLISKYKLKADSVIHGDPNHHRAVEVKLIYQRSDPSLAPSENPGFTMKSRIPLSLE